MHVADWPLWENKDIGRRLSPQGITAVMRFVNEGGNCEWVDAAKTTARIFYKTPSQWATTVHEYIDGAGLAGTMCVVYDLISGDTTTDARESRQPTPSLRCNSQRSSFVASRRAPQPRSPWDSG